MGIYYFFTIVLLFFTSKNNAALAYIIIITLRRIVSRGGFGGCSFVRLWGFRARVLLQLFSVFLFALFAGEEISLILFRYPKIICFPVYFLICIQFVYILYT